MHDRSLVHLDDGLRGWRAVAQSTVWSDGVAVPPPLLDDDLCLFEGVADFPIEQFIPEPSIETLTISILSG